MRRGQGTFEYVLLLGGVLLIVVLAIVVLQNTAQQSFKGAGTQQCTARLMTELGCNSLNGWNQCGKFDTTNYAGCTVGDAVYPAGCPAPAPVLGATEKYCGTKAIQ